MTVATDSKRAAEVEAPVESETGKRQKVEELTQLDRLKTMTSVTNQFPITS